MTDTRTTHPVRVSRLAARPGQLRPWVAVCGGCEWATAEPTQDEAVRAADAHATAAFGPPAGEGE